MGLDARIDEILTSALATAAMLEAQGAAGSSAFVIGGKGIREALAASAIRVLGGEPERADLVVIGWDPEVDYAAFRTASLLVERGARLIATNPDTSFPAADGLWPGAGALLAVVTTTTGETPLVVGKPAPAMFEQAAKLAGAERPLMIGDRLDTDIAGAAGAGWDSLLVLSGVSRASDLPGAPALPTYVAPDVTALLAPRTPSRIAGAAPTDAGAVGELLAASGLEPDSPEARLTGSVVAREPDGRLAATATCVLIGGVNYLRSVAVRQDLRDGGLGILIVAAAIRSGDPNAPTYLATDGAGGLFERLGFERIGNGDVPAAILDVMARQGCVGTASVMRRAPTASGAKSRAG
jgi:ribonucleotide monophosphatase NagD (HAD superfamily)/N-acetylglutamate synthase-like GNAT family acetyltransferase